MRAGATCHDVHVAVAKGFHERGYHLGHVTGHSIGMTMIEFPKIGEGVEIELAENMVLSMHPHAIAANGEDCLYMQDTWLVTADGGVPLATLPMEIVQSVTPGGRPRRNEDGVVRCWWGGGRQPEYRAYHDEEWGLPVERRPTAVREALPRGVPVGLSWLTILRKRDGFPRAFAGLRSRGRRRPSATGTSSACSATRRSCATVARSSRRSTTPGALLELVGRARLARRATSGASSRACDRPAGRITYAWLLEQAQTDASRALAKDLKRRGWTFVGPTTVYAFMQAMGLVNDHLDGCRRCVRRARRRGHACLSREGVDS